mgnify:CR=1 FL=1
MPVLDEGKCIDCGMCDMVCPDLCLVWSTHSDEDGRPTVKLDGVDYQYCKGCMRCVETCAVGAMTREAETPGLADSLRDEEVKRARAQLKSSLLMALESTGARCEQIAQHLLIFGRVITVDEMVAKIDAIDAGQIATQAREIFSKPPVLAAVGPLDNLEPFDAITRRLAA